jgi:hypothetical protein
LPGLALVMVVTIASVAGAGSYRLLTRIAIPGGPAASTSVGSIPRPRPTIWPIGQCRRDIINTKDRRS